MACDVDRVHRRPLDGVFWLSRRSAELAGMQRAEAAGYCERFCMKYHWRKSDFEIGSCEAMRKRTQATVIAKIWSRTAFPVFPGN